MSKKRGPNAALATPPPKAEPKKDAAKPADKKPEPAEKPKRRFFGLLRRKEKWVLSWRGRFVVWGGLVVLGVICILKVHPFLCVTDRVDTQYLVVEGWVPNYALQESIAEFKSRPYTKIFTVGGTPLTGNHIEPGDNIALEACNRLKWMGASPDVLQACPSSVEYRNRTFESARALRKWMEDNHVPTTSFNLVTLGAHARRSRLLFEEAFDGKTSVGIISITNREYDPKHWWKYSEGVREIIGESIAYVYARFFFHHEDNDTN
jgi:hypothetical protein